MSTKINIQSQSTMTFRTDCFGTGFDIDYFQNKSSNKVLTQFADIEGLMSALNLLLTGLIKQFFTIVGLVGLMFYQSFSLSCIAFIGFPLVIYPVYLIGRKFLNFAL